MTTPTRSHLRPYLWTLGLAWGLPALLVALGWLVLPKDLPAGQCEGIGFGCTLAPADSLLLLGVLVSPILLAVGAGAVALVAVVQGIRGRSSHGSRPAVLQSTRTGQHDGGR